MPLAKQPGAPGGPQPVGMRTATFDHGTDFNQVKRDLDNWYSNDKTVKQPVTINTFPVADHVGKTVHWYTVIHYILFL